MVFEKIFQVAQFLDQAVLWLLVFLSVMSIAIIIERYLYLRKVNAASTRVRTRIRMALATNNLDEVQEIGRDLESVEGRAVSLALKHIKESGSKGLEELFSSFSLSEKPELEKKLSFLATLGSNAPYIGLFGTVLGIMKAFNDLSKTTEAGSQTVMAGISMALIATAAGLFVAIPAVAAYNYFQRKVKTTLQNLESTRDLCVAYAKKKGT